MCKIALKAFEYQMKSNQSISNFFQNLDLLLLMDNSYKSQLSQINQFMFSFKNIWADNGDYLSKHYTGTASTISNVTRQGKCTFSGIIDHGMVSLNRFYVRNFEDQFKQECIDIILGENLKNNNSF